MIISSGNETSAALVVGGGAGDEAPPSFPRSTQRKGPCTCYVSLHANLIHRYSMSVNIEHLSASA
jgi:hypothetical protein